MPTTFKPCDKSVADMVKAILESEADHADIYSADVKLDLVFACPPTDDDGKVIGVALKKNGRRSYAQTRICNLRERAKGHGDAEIVIDADHWESINDAEQRAILDHELTHIHVKTNKAGDALTDDLSRPILKLRRHDIEVGWFTSIAKRNKIASIECKQAAEIMENLGQYYWPSIIPPAVKSAKQPKQLQGA
jgi:hypothetical protein